MCMVMTGVIGMHLGNDQLSGSGGDDMGGSHLFQQTVSYLGQNRQPQHIHKDLLIKPGGWTMQDGRWRRVDGDV